MILLYHLVFPDNTPKSAWNAGLILRLSAFKRQMLWLKKHGEILSLDDYVKVFQDDPGKLKGKFALTFDDGYQQVFDLIAPFLKEERIPATFFATTSHLEDGELLWFVYINALCSEQVYDHVEVNGKGFDLTCRRSSMAAWRALIDAARASKDPIAYAREIAAKYPLTEPVRERYLGLSEDQFRQIGSNELFMVGGHTHQHLFLDQISKEDQVQQLTINKQRLEKLTGQLVTQFAYTGGIYTKESISAVKQAGFTSAMAIKPKNMGDEQIFELPRVEVYSQSLIKFRIKVSGLYHFAKRYL